MTGVVVDTGYISYLIAATRKFQFCELAARWLTAVWALEGKSLRYQEFPGYKSSRAETHKKREELRKAVEEVRESISKAESLTTAFHKDCEGDDIVALLLYSGNFKKVVGVDKDYHVLEVELGVQFVDSAGNPASPLKTLLKKQPKWAVSLCHPSDTLDSLILHALLGDSSDDIPRIIYQKHHDLVEKVLSGSSQEKLQAALSIFGDQFELNLNLVSLPYYKLLGFRSAVEMYLSGVEEIKKRSADFCNSELQFKSQVLEDW
ncbi:MAG: hypothetical protein QXS68_07695 [Candidatus Methanomethylicaceae archaeon]